MPFIHLVENMLIDSLTWVLMSFMVHNLNDSLALKYNEIPVDVHFYNAYFMKTLDEKNLSDALLIYQLDSIYLTETLKPVLDEIDFNIIKKYHADSLESYLFEFYYGRFLSNMKFDNFRIDITLKRPRDCVLSYKGLKLEIQPFFDSLYLPNDMMFLINALGFERYYTLYLLAHELSHYIDFLNLEKKYGRSYLKIRRKMSNEYKTDLHAYQLLKDYLIKPGLKFYFENE